MNFPDFLLSASVSRNFDSLINRVSERFSGELFSSAGQLRDDPSYPTITAPSRVFSD